MAKCFTEAHVDGLLRSVEATNLMLELWADRDMPSQGLSDDQGLSRGRSSATALFDKLYNMDNDGANAECSHLSQ